MTFEIEPLVFRVVVRDAQLQFAIDQFGGNLARKTAADLNLDLRVSAPVVLDVIQKIERGRLVCADRKAAGRVIAQFSESVLEIELEVLKAPGVIEDDLAGVGQKKILGGAVDQFFPQHLLQAVGWPGRQRVGFAATSQPPGRSSFPWRR